MAPTKTEADYIQLLLSIMEETEGKTDWKEVARKTGLYKDGKFVRQAFNSIKTKYGNASAPAAVVTTPASIKSAKIATSNKRAKTSDESDEAIPSKKAKSSARESAVAIRSKQGSSKKTENNTGEGE